MKYFVYGISMESGVPESFTVEAGSEAEARGLASQRRVAVERLEAIELDPPATRPATAAGRWIATLSAVASGLLVAGVVAFLAAEWLAEQRALISDQRATINDHESVLASLAEQTVTLTLERDDAIAERLSRHSEAAATEALLEQEIASLKQTIAELRFPADSVVVERDTHWTSWLPLKWQQSLQLKLVRTSVNGGPWSYSVTFTASLDGEEIDADLTEQEARHLSAALEKFQLEPPGRPEGVSSEIIYVSDTGTLPRLSAGISLQVSSKSPDLLLHGTPIQVGKDFGDLLDALDTVLLNIDRLRRNPEALPDLLEWETK